ncbi:hypothetical protein VTJ04DRAFT_9753 [Mycothermus thermophilus]|uniref:uncharacterized protein n=1 Tax=Humicola insolens TaxID=85995 RepID=UPI0037427EBB
MAPESDNTKSSVTQAPPPIQQPQQHPLQSPSPAHLNGGPQTAQPPRSLPMDPSQPHAEDRHQSLDLRGGNRGGPCPGRFCFCIPCPLPFDCCVCFI